MNSLVKLFLATTLLVSFYGCDSSESGLGQKSSSITRECNYQNKPISCEEFDRLMGRNKPANDGASSEKGPVVLGAEISIRANYTKNKIVLLDDVKLESAKEMEDHKYSCAFNFKKESPFIVDELNELLITRVFNPENPTEYIDVEFKKQNATQYLYSDVLKEDGEVITSEILVELNKATQTVRFMSRCQFE